MQFENGLEKKLWTSFEQKLLKGQEDPYIEEILFSPSDSQKDLNDAIRGGWDELILKTEENNFDYLYEENLGVRKRIFDDVLFEFRADIRDFYESLPEERQDEMDEDEFKAAIFEKFEEEINSNELELRDGYIQFQYGWNGSENVRFNVEWRGSGDNVVCFENLRPSKSIVGLLELLNINPEDFRQSMLTRVITEEAFENAEDLEEALSGFNDGLDQALKDFKTVFGGLHLDKSKPSAVSSNDFADWYNDVYFADEELGSSGFAITVEMDGDELTKLCEGVAYIKGSAENKTVENYLYKISIGSGAELFCAEGSVSQPLRLSAPIEFVADDSIYVDRDSAGSSVEWDFVNLNKIKDFHSIVYARENDEKYGFNSTYFKTACQNVKLNPWRVTILGDKKELVLNNGGQEIGFEREDALSPVNPDLLKYLKTPEGAYWGVKDGMPAANLLVFSSSFDSVVDFVRESGIPTHYQDENGNNALHCILNKVSSRYMYNVLEKASEWVSKETLFAKNNEGLSPLDLYIRAYGKIDNPLPECLILAFDAAGIQWNKPYGSNGKESDKSMAQIFKIENHDFVQRQKLQERAGISAADVLSIRSAL